MKKLFILLVVLAGFGVSSFAQNSATAVGTSNAKIIKPLTLSYNAASPLEFGTVSVGSGGSVTIASATGAPTASGAVLYTGGATRSAATFTVNGESAMTYSVTLPGNSDVVLTTGDGATADKKMSVTDFEKTATLTLTGSDQTLKVGGKLNVSATQVPGAYTGTFSVTVIYN